jgi:hypothetical protein
MDDSYNSGLVDSGTTLMFLSESTYNSVTAELEKVCTK